MIPDAEDSLTNAHWTRPMFRGCRCLVALLLAAAVALLAVGGASGSPTVTIGQTDAGASASAGTPGWFVQTGVASGADFVVPEGSWRITGWSTYARGAGAQSLSMMVFRPDGLGHYTVVGQSPLEALAPGSLNSFADVDLPVQAGDRLGLYDPIGNAVVASETGAAGDVLAHGMTATQPAVGALLDPSAVLSGLYRLNVSAELTPVDATAPTTTISLSPPAPNGSNGWYTEPVSVSVGADSAAFETRCVLDPTAPPTSFGEIPQGCPYLGVGADVVGDGDHEVYAASEGSSGGDEPPVRVSLKIDRTPPTVTCTAPTPLFPLGSGGGAVGATVSDDGSGPAAASVWATAPATAAGAHTITLSGQDDAGNTTTVACPYLVGYTFDGFLTPLPKTSVNSGSTLPLKFQLRDASGQPIDDAEARSLVAPSCKLAIILTNPAGPLTGCPRYDANAQQFQFNLKTTDAMKGANGVSLAVVLDDTVVTTGPEELFTVR